MDRTITALYDTRSEAEAAKRQILDAIGDGDAHVDIASSEGGQADAKADDEGFLEKLKHFFMADEDRHAYSEGMRRGGYLLTARVDEAQADAVCRLLDQTEAVDLDARQKDWAASGWQRQPAARPSAPENGGPSAAPGDGSERIPIIEERFKVGKREVERGTVRVRSYVEEQPVHEQIDLTEERVEVERRPVERTLGGAEAENLFKDRTIEMTERGEEAVVAKDAVVTEEIGLRKEADRHTETIDDTVRRTRVDIDDQGSEGDRGTSTGAEASPRHEGRSFEPDDDSVAMDPDGGSARETEEERLRRLEKHPGGRPIPL